MSKHNTPDVQASKDGALSTPTSTLVVPKFTTAFFEVDSLEKLSADARYLSVDLRKLADTKVENQARKLYILLFPQRKQWSLRNV